MLIIQEVADLEQPLILSKVCAMDFPLPSVVDGDCKVIFDRFIRNVIVVAVSHAITAKIKEFIKERAFLKHFRS